MRALSPSVSPVHPQLPECPQALECGHWSAALSYSRFLPSDIFSLVALLLTVMDILNEGLYPGPLPPDVYLQPPTQCLLLEIISKEPQILHGKTLLLLESSPSWWVDNSILGP